MSLGPPSPETRGPAPLILTVWLDDATFGLLDGLRRRHFPPERNIVPAHLTLFHALPGADAPRVTAELDALCRRQPPIRLDATGYRSLGRGVALAFAAPRLVALRTELAREWRDGLTAQDSAKIAPHVTIQNKVSPAEARALLAELSATFTPFTARAEGLSLWRYLGGPWEPVRRFRFAG